MRFVVHIQPVPEFLSTPSARRATERMARAVPSRVHFYPRPPRGGRRCRSAAQALARMISIHALREEGDKRMGTLPCTGSISIHALREEGDWTSSAFPLLTATISIHALREEGDASCASWGPERSHFYPRPPRGGRLYSWRPRHAEIDFYPRPPRGGRRCWIKSSRSS